VLFPGTGFQELQKDNQVYSASILVVDDDMIIRKLYQVHLENAGYQVIEASNGQEALDLLVDHSPDLVLLDANMPVLDGFQTCAEFRRVTENEDIPVIMITAMDDGKSVDRAFDAGATDYMIKPVNWIALIRRLDLMINARVAQQELKSSEERCKLIAETSPVAIFISKISGKEIIYCNAAAAELVGMSAPQVLECEAEAFYYDIKDREALVASVSSGEIVRNREIRLRKVDDNVIWGLVSFQKMSFGDEDHIISVVVDITKEKERRRQLIQTTKMATLGEMATGMAHEINQPLNIICMASESAGEMLDVENIPVDIIKTKLARIEEQSRRASAIINHMRIFGRVSDGNLKPIPLCECLNDSVRLMSEQLRIQKVGIAVNFNGDCATVKGERIQLEQVFVNLLCNARDATSRQLEEGAIESGKIDVHLTSSRQENEACIIFRDNGGGIIKQARDRIFEPFFTTKEIGEGTGLGLSVSYGIIKEMGGRIDAANVGDGAEFRVYLPKTDPDTDDGSGKWDNESLSARYAGE